MVWDSEHDGIVKFVSEDDAKVWSQGGDLEQKKKLVTHDESRELVKGVVNIP